MPGTCPKCDTTVDFATVEAIQVARGAETRFKGVSFTCPKCNVVLGVSLDPLALVSDTVNQVVRRLSAAQARGAAKTGGAAKSPAPAKTGSTQAKAGAATKRTTRRSKGGAAKSRARKK